MANKPVYYKQTDPRWSRLDYSAKGEQRTIGSSGCGPTCAAMLIATYKDKSVTPVTTCNWSKYRGYKYKNQGTAYSYFEPQFKEYGMKCTRLNTSNSYGSATDDSDKKALRLLKAGTHILISCQGKGTLTSSGHFVICYAYKDGYAMLNDPLGTISKRLKCGWTTFAKQTKYWFAVEIPKEARKTILNAKVGDELIVSTNGGNLRCRSSKSISNNNNIIGYFKNGKTVILVEKTDSKILGSAALWYKVRAKGIDGETITGYVSTKYLSLK